MSETEVYEKFSNVKNMCVHLCQGGQRGREEGVYHYYYLDFLFFRMWEPPCKNYTFYFSSGNKTKKLFAVEKFSFFFLFNSVPRFVLFSHCQSFPDAIFGRVELVSPKLRSSDFVSRR